MATPAEQVKEKLGIVEVISGYVKLERAGANFKARCPFHTEKTPSFFVSPSRNAYYCFGCGEKGDIFTFVERMEGLDFRGALKQLADRAGVIIRYEPRESKDKRERLFELLEAATKLFEKNLASHKRAHEYLAGRGVTQKTIERFRIGYALPEWRNAIEHLVKRGFREAEVIEAGLAKEAETPRGKRIYDRFRGRIMFPLADPSGRTIGFSGRFLENVPGQKEAAEPAKYINSPETDVYHKSRVLYGYDLAKLSMRKSDFAILVEGQMDLVLSHQGGFPNTVALSGTALTSEHLDLVARMTKRLVLALDADQAGIRSAGRGAHMALRAGFDLKVAELPAGKDPADIVRQDPEAYRRIIRSSVHIVDFFLALFARLHTGRALIRKVEEVVLPYVAEIESPLDRAHFVKRVAEAAALPESAVLASLERALRAEVPRSAEALEAPAAPVIRVERILELLFGLWKWLLPSYASAVSSSKEKAKALLGEKFDEYESAHGAKEDALALMVESTHESEAAGLRHLEVLGRELERAVIKDELAAAAEALAAAEKEANDDARAAHLRRTHELAERLKRL